jgi:hypothetical protein
MAEIPQPAFSVSDISEWFELQRQLAALKSRESLARANVFKHCFPEGSYKPEGTNNFELPDHWLLKAVTSLNRTLSIETLRALSEELFKMGVVVDDLVRWKPELDLPAYRALNDEQRKVFDQALEIKPGTPQMKIELPAKFKNAGGNLAAPTVVDKQTPF